MNPSTRNLSSESNREYNSKVNSKSRKASTESCGITFEHNDVLLWGWCIKISNSKINSTSSKVTLCGDLPRHSLKLTIQKQIYLYPNRLEIQSDSLLIPVDEILSVNLVQTKSGNFQHKLYYITYFRGLYRKIYF